MDLRAAFNLCNLPVMEYLDFYHKAGSRTLEAAFNLCNPPIMEKAASLT